MTKVSIHLMFEGDAEAAIELYASVFPDFSVVSLERYGTAEAGKPGTVKQAQALLAGQRFVIIDSPIEHAFTFTPSMSVFVDFKTAGELEQAFQLLSEGGEIMMPLDDYGFSARFGWLADRFGVSWQLNLPKEG